MSNQAHPAGEPLPPEVKWLFAFQSCNAVNFTIALGAPLVLTARYIGCSEGIIGLLNALGPLMVVLQLFAAGAIHRMGYRRLMLMGWGARSFMLLLIVPLPFLVGTVPGAWLVAGMVVPIFLFNAIRGFASAAWLPWLSAILPPGKRGLFLGTEQRVMNLSAFVTLIACGAFLGANPERWQYSTLFVLAWIAGMMSVVFLKRAPEAHPKHDESEDSRRLSSFFRRARRAWRRRRFRHVTLYAALFTFAGAAQPIFLILFLKEGLDVAEGIILKLQAGAMLGVLLTAVFWGKLSDAVGSKPLLRISNLVIGLVFFYWTLAAFNAFTPGLVDMGAIYILGGIFTAAHAVGQVRLVLGSCPERETTSGMVVYQVVVALAGGMAPILFGFGLEEHRRFDATNFPFALAFGLMVALMAASQYLLGRVRESGAHPTRRVLTGMLYDWPIKVLSGLPVGGRRRG